jgi:hypothetical protein
VEFFFIVLINIIFRIVQIRNLFLKKNHVEALQSINKLAKNINIWKIASGNDKRTPEMPPYLLVLRIVINEILGKEDDVNSVESVKINNINIFSNGPKQIMIEQKREFENLIELCEERNIDKTIINIMKNIAEKTGKWNNLVQILKRILISGLFDVRV